MWVIVSRSRSVISVESLLTTAFWLPCTMVVVVFGANMLPTDLLRKPMDLSGATMLPPVIWVVS
jgi:hypothetical protein